MSGNFHSLKMIEIQNYFEEKKKLHEHILTYIEDCEFNKKDFEDLINYIQSQDIFNNREEFEHFLRLILNICNNHHRYPGFFDKIKQIFFKYKKEIKQTFSNHDLFNLFNNNKMILLFLLNNDFIDADVQIIEALLNKCELNGIKYCHFFFPEIKKVISDDRIQEIENELLEIDPKIFDNYESKRQKGENDSYICTLIQNDSVEEFIQYTTQACYSFKNEIKPSIFETNEFLNNNTPKLIEYAAFFGSIQIFNYLRMNKVELTPSLWIYAIHSDNAELIHLLEEFNCKKSFSFASFSCEELLCESIKCHHNDIINYFIMIDNEVCPDYNYSSYYSEIEEEEEEGETIRDCNLAKNIINTCFCYSNYSYLPNNFNQNFVFFNLAKFKYSKMVEIYMKAKEEFIESLILTKKIFFSFNLILI